jgi:hypothetical protein
MRALIYYTPYEVPKNKQLVPVANCPKCGVPVFRHMQVPE